MSMHGVSKAIHRYKMTVLPLEEENMDKKNFLALIKAKKVELDIWGYLTVWR